MREVFIKAITEESAKNDRIRLLVADMGYSVVEKFKEEFEFNKRFLNVGIAEQNMMGIAAGLALCGDIVFTYTFCNFSTQRCLEQIRNDICYPNANVKIIGIGAGFSYGTLGMTHHSIDDIPAMMAFPNMTIITPCDPIESELSAYAVMKHEGPCYIRLRKKGENIVHGCSDPGFTIGKGSLVADGDDLTIIGSGWILNNAMAARKELEKKGYSVRVISMHTIKPIDRDIILEAARETNAVITVEDQSINALGSSVALELMQSPYRHTKFEALGLHGDDFYNDVGSEEFHLRKNGLSPSAIEGVAEFLMRGK